VSEDDVLFGFWLRLFTLVEELDNVSGAWRAVEVDRSAYYRWKRAVDRWGLEALPVRERRRPRMPNRSAPIPSSGSSPLAWATQAGAPAHLGRAGPGQMGWDPGLRARGVAGAAPLWARHALRAPGADRPPRRPL
jgi:hypothetical protein